jgi:hypothetical protein
MVFGIKIATDNLDNAEKQALAKIRELVDEINESTRTSQYCDWFEFKYNSIKAESELMCYRYKKSKLAVLTVRERAPTAFSDSDQILKLEGLFYFIKNLEGFKAALEYKRL